MKRVIDGLVISLVCSGIIGGALALATHSLSLGLGGMTISAMYIASIYFTGPT